MVRNPNDTDLSNRNDESFQSEDPEVLQLSPCNSSSQNKSPTNVSQHNQLQLAMNMADMIRRYEKESIIRGRNTKVDTDSDGISSSYSYYNDYVHPIISNARNFWETPGIQAGCITACCCIIPIIPIRRSVLHYMNHSLNLGTTFPDLLFTPAITMLVAQCSVYVGTCYGVLHYLNTIRSAPITQTETALTQSGAKSQFFNSTDPIFMDATNVVRSPSTDQSSPSFMRQYDVRNRVTAALYDAVQSCRQRRELTESECQRP
jgi:hypothetical protein